MNIILQPEKSSICGQCCIAMITGQTVENIISAFKSKGATSTKQLIAVLLKFNFFSDCVKLMRIKKSTELPALSVLKVKWFIKGSHWVVLNNGFVYDPAYGVCDLEGYGQFISDKGKITSYLTVKR